MKKPTGDYLRNSLSQLIPIFLEQSLSSKQCLTTTFALDNLHAHTSIRLRNRITLCPVAQRDDSRPARLHNGTFTPCPVAQRDTHALPGCTTGHSCPARLHNGTTHALPGCTMGRLTPCPVAQRDTHTLPGCTAGHLRPARLHNGTLTPCPVAQPLHPHKNN